MTVHQQPLAVWGGKRDRRVFINLKILKKIWSCSLPFLFSYHNFMATSSSSILPIASTDSEAEVDEKQLRGAAISKAGASAAFSYMACAGNFVQICFVPLDLIICVCCMVTRLELTEAVSCDVSEFFVLIEMGFFGGCLLEIGVFSL